MSKAIVLITANPGKDREIAKKLKKVEGVENVYLAAGRYDVVAEIQAADGDSMLALVYDKIRKIDNIKKTQTMFCLKV
jgi:DNA-binding Lrp family transcriptional regulator